MPGYTYIVTNKYRTVLYIGVTADLSRRSYQHASGTGSVFTSKYNCTDLVWYEYHLRIEDAIAREKQLKNWKRDWKLDLIRSMNPEMKTLDLVD